MKRIITTYNQNLFNKLHIQGLKRLSWFQGAKMISCLMLFSLFVVSCNEDEFLDKKPHTPTDNSFYTSSSGAEQGINAAYDILQLGENVERAFFSGTVCSGDALTGGEPGGNDQAALQRIMKFANDPTNPYCVNLWNYLYRGIYRCNLIIYYIGEPVENFDEGLRKRILGEAYFLRGYFHFKLQVIFGGMPQMQTIFNNQLKGVPFIDHVLLQDEWNPTRPELTYTWGKIEEDFKTAAEMLPWSHDASNIGRATKGAAKAMLAKTYLYQEKWEESFQAAKEVIESGNYYLIGENGHNEPLKVTRIGKNGLFDVVMKPYKWIWQPEANNCAESIFEVQHKNTGTNTFPEGQEGSLIPRYYGPRAVYAWTVDIATKTDVLATQEYFWGFMLPTKYFIETAYERIGCEVNGQIVDPRFKIAVVGPEDKFPYFYADARLREQYPDSVKYAPWFNNPATGYCTMKYFQDPYYNGAEGSPYTRGSLGDHPVNTKDFRFADLLLIGAEAGVKSGHNGEALTWINRVRERARNSGDNGYPKALSAVSVEDVWNERRVELAFEGHQFWDIVRTGRQQKILKEEAMEYATTVNPGQTVTEQFGDGFIVGKHEIWPIPDAEIRNTNGSVTQNPGY